MPIPLDQLTGQMALVDEVLRRDHETTLENFLSYRRANSTSYELIARELSAMVDVDGFTVGYQTARRWCKRLGIKATMS